MRRTAVVGGLVAVLVLSWLTLGYSRPGKRMFSNVTPEAMLDRTSDATGACWADIDGDGDQDLFVPVHGRAPSRLWRNDGAGAFTDIGMEAGIARRELTLAIGCAFVDLDNDGDPDLYVTAQSNRDRKRTGKQSTLYRNDGGGRFTDVTDTAGVGLSGSGAVSSDWADYDGDGDYDGFVAVRFGKKPNAFFEQRAPFVFADVAAAKGLARPVRTMTAFVPSWFDVDGDGDVDLLLVYDFWGIELYRNDGGTFVPVTGAAFPRATDSTPGAPPNNPMGVTWGDYDNDGCVDLYVSSINVHGQSGFDEKVVTADSPSRLYRSDCNLAFADVTRPLGIRANGLTEWAANFVDFDNDGDLDLAVVAGNTSEAPPEGLQRLRGAPRKAVTYVVTGLRKLIPARWVAWAYRYEAMVPASGNVGVAAAMPNMLYQNQLVETGRAGFVDVTERMGVRIVSAVRGSAWADFDGDGDLDWFIPGRGTGNYLFRNDGPVGHYLRVHLVGSRLRDAVGSWVKISVAGRTQLRHVHVLDGYLSQSQMDPHFGIGAAERVEEVWVRWPGSAQWQLACRDVPANSTITITQGQGCRR